jgi:sugar lactone lactonase YvrE
MFYRIIIVVCCFQLLITFFSHAQEWFNNPESVVFDSLHNCYLVSNWGDGTIVRIDSTGDHSYFNDDYLNEYQIAGLYIYGDTLLAAAGVGVNAGVAAFSLDTGDLLYWITIPNIGLPNDITSDSTGTVWVTDYWESRLYRIVDRTPSLYMDQGLGDPNGILYDAREHRLFYVSATNPGRPIMEVDIADSTLSTVLQTGLYSVDGIVFDTDYNVYVSDWYTDAVQKFDADLTGESQVFSSGHNDPADIYYDRFHDQICVPNFSSNSVDFVPLHPTAVDRVKKSALPVPFALHQNYPNPFNPSTLLGFELSAAGFTVLKIYDIHGRELSTPVHDWMDAGVHTVTFDASDLSSGVYFYRVTSGSFSACRKMLLLK